jgi:hypothetical protein
MFWNKIPEAQAPDVAKERIFYGDTRHADVKAKLSHKHGTYKEETVRRTLVGICSQQIAQR